MLTGIDENAPNALASARQDGRVLRPLVLCLRGLCADPKEGARQFRICADSHDPNVPVLCEEAMSRDRIYPDLG